MDINNMKFAIRAKELAQQKMENKDFAGAKTLAMKAKNLSNDVENIEQMILVCDVHCSSQEKVGENNENNWYKILNIDPSADQSSVKKQYRKMSLALHPDKNKFPGASGAFQLIREASDLLTDNEKRRMYDCRCKVVSEVVSDSGMYKMQDWVNEVLLSRSRGTKKNDKPGRNPRANGRGSKKVDGLNNSTRFDGLVKCGEKRMASVADCDVVEIDGASKRSKNSGVFDVNAQKVDKQDNEGALNADNSNKRTRNDGLKKSMGSDDDCEVVEIDCIPTRSKNIGFFDVNTQKVDKQDNDGGWKVNDSSNPTLFEGLTESTMETMASMEDCEVKVDHTPKRSENIGSFDINALEVDKRDNDGGSEVKNLSNPTLFEAPTESTKEKMASMGDCEVAVEHISKRSENSGFSDVNAHEADKRDNDGGSKVNNSSNPTMESTKEAMAGMGDCEVEVNRKSKRSKDSRFVEVKAQEVDKKGRRKDKFASKSEQGGQQSKFQAKNLVLDSKILEYSDPQFNDFEKERSKNRFKAGQIWAIYDTLDAMPRFYALIKKVVSKDFKIQITWLESNPSNENEIKWVCQGLPTSCGRFRLGESETIEDHAIFSHLVNCEKGITKRKNTCEIYPRKGETWAIFRKWDMNWCLDPEKHYKDYEFHFVEILSDYNHNVGVRVGLLKKVKKYSCLFSRRVGDELLCRLIPGKDMFKFSHRVLSFQMTGDEGFNGVRRFFELDPASICQPTSKIEVIEIN